MFLLLVELEVNPTFSGELENVLQSLVKLAEQESGTIYYAAHRSQERKNAFVLYELYKDRAAWDAHLQTEPVQKALRKFETILVAPPKLTFCDTISTTSIG